MGTLFINDTEYKVLRVIKNDDTVLQLEVEDGKTVFINKMSNYQEFGKTPIFKLIYGEYRWSRPLLDGSSPWDIDMSKLTREDARIGYLWSVRVPGKNPPPLTREQGSLLGLKLNETSETFDGYA